MIEKVSKSVIEYFVEEISTTESKEKLKDKLLIQYLCILLIKYIHL